MLLLVLHVVSVLFSWTLFPCFTWRVVGVGPLSKKWPSGGRAAPLGHLVQAYALHRGTCINQRVIQETPQACSCPHSDLHIIWQRPVVPRAWTWMGRWDAYLIRSCIFLTAPAASTLLGPSLACWRGTQSHLQQRKEGCGANPLHCRMPGNVKQVQVHLGSLLLPRLPVTTKYKNKVFKKNFSVQKVKLINQW